MLGVWGRQKPLLSVHLQPLQASPTLQRWPEVPGWAESFGLRGGVQLCNAKYLTSALALRRQRWAGAVLPSTGMQHRGTVTSVPVPCAQLDMFLQVAVGQRDVALLNCSPSAYEMGFEGKLRNEATWLFLSLHQPGDFN